MPQQPSVKKDFAVGFFPFKVKQIVDAIIGAYYAGSEKVEIVFEGPTTNIMSLNLFAATMNTRTERN